MNMPINSMQKSVCVSLCIKIDLMSKISSRNLVQDRNISEKTIRRHSIWMLEETKTVCAYYLFSFLGTWVFVGLMLSMFVNFV